MQYTITHSPYPVYKIRCIDEFHQTILYANNNALALDFGTGSGGSARATLAHNFIPHVHELPELKKYLDSPGAALDEDHIFKLAKPLFETGSYQLACYPHALASLNLVTLSNKQGDYHPYVSDKGGSNWFLATQETDQLSRNRVNEYKKLINSGIHPIILTFGISLLPEQGNELVESPCFILDGHHKLQAYSELGKTPLILTVKKEVSSIYDVHQEYHEVNPTSYLSLFQLYNEL